jgi:protein-tyrosine-phosphatase
MRPGVLFLCVHNAGRSQMAAGFMRTHGGDSVEVLSAGSEPAASLNPVAVQAMREVGIDIAAQTPRRWSEEMIGSVDVVVTMGCGDTCPYVPGTRYIDWEIEDPAGKDLNLVRPIRDELERRVKALLAELVGGPAQPA